MKTFVVSDLHGTGEVYDSIMAYLEKISQEDEVELYINGDLIDRGFDSFRMLADVKKRCEGQGNIKVHYLGGNHELMMYQFYEQYIKKGINYSYNNTWFDNGGWVTEGVILEQPREERNQYYEFVGDLKIYQKMPYLINKKRILLVHSRAPEEVLDECPFRIKDDNPPVHKAVNTIEKEIEYLKLFKRKVKVNSLGKEGYLVINGHTAVDDKKGFAVDKKQNAINIDGGCEAYAKGDFKQDKAPLIEIKNGLIKILVFNHDNQIVKGYYYDGNLSPMTDEELTEARSKLDPSLNGNAEKNRKLIKQYIA